MFHRSASPFVTFDDADSYSPFYPSRARAVDSYLPASYDAYDLERSQLEQALLARKQRERREAEAAAYVARQRQRQRLELELERRAAIEQAVRDEYERREVERALTRRRHEEQELQRQYIEAIKAKELERQRTWRARAAEEERRRQLEAAATKPQPAAARSQQADLGDFFRMILDNSSHQRSKDQEQEAAPVEPASTATPPRSFDPSDFLQQFFGASQLPGSGREACSLPTAPNVPARAAEPTPSSSEPNVPPPSAAITQPPAPSKKEEDAAEPHSSDEEAATTVQRHFHRHLARRNALAKLSSLSSTFADRQSSFVRPTSFTFQQPSPASSPANATPPPPLAFGSANSAFLSHEDFLVNLLSKIDAVESGGDRQVKQERKSLVRRVEKELSRLDAMKERAWEHQQLEKDAQLSPTPATDVQKMPKEVVEQVLPTDEQVPSSSESSPLDNESSTPSTDPVAHAEPTPLGASVESLEALLPAPTPEPAPAPASDLALKSTPPLSPPLTKEALATLDDEPAAAPVAPRSTSGSSTTSSTLTASTDSADDDDDNHAQDSGAGPTPTPVSSDDTIAEVRRQAEKLGREVEKLEAAEFVVVGGGGHNEDGIFFL
ncbi:hypothetical protein JCM11491_001564 [Sporobolomyces phaffii]